MHVTKFKLRWYIDENHYHEQEGDGQLVQDTNKNIFFSVLQNVASKLDSLILLFQRPC